MGKSGLLFDSDYIVVEIFVTGIANAIGGNPTSVWSAAQLGTTISRMRPKYSSACADVCVPGNKRNHSQRKCEYAH